MRCVLWQPSPWRLDLLRRGCLAVSNPTPALGVDGSGRPEPLLAALVGLRTSEGGLRAAGPRRENPATVTQCWLLAASEGTHGRA